MKPEIATHLLKQTIDNWWVIREKLSQIGYKMQMTHQAEMEFIEAKGTIARNMQPIIHIHGNPQEMRETVIRFMRKVSSLDQLQQLPSPDLKMLEKESHHIYIQLNRWFAELNLN